MTSIDRLLRRIDPDPLVIGRDSTDVYMIRYRLFKFRWFNVYAHHFSRGDLDPCLHDHPWRFVTLILAGGYTEILANGERWRPPGTLLYRSATHRHRVVTTRPAWSVVVTGPRIRRWGFFGARGWRAWFPGMTPICE